MKKIFALILPLFLLFSCGDSQHVTDTLDRAEQLMENTPDSALAVLNRLDTDSVREQRNRARLALLKSQALDKTYNDVKDDSLITIATDYYADAGDPHNEMLSQYYLGRVKFNNDEFAPSLIAMFQTLEIAKQLDDPFWTAMAAREIGRVYTTVYNATEAIAYYKLALDKFVESGNERFFDSAIFRYIKSLNNSFNHDSCLILANKVLDTGSEGYGGHHVKSSRWKKAIINTLGTTHYGQESFNEATHVFELNLANENSKLDDTLWYAVSSIRSGAIPPNIRHIMNRAENDSDRLVSELKYRYYIAVDSPYKALKYAEIIEDWNNTELLKRIYQDLSTPVFQLFESQKEAKQAVIDRNRQTTVVVVSLAALIIGIAAWLIYKHISRQKAAIYNSLEIVHDLRSMLTLRDTEMKQAQESIRKLLNTRFSYFDELCSVYYANNNEYAAKKISDELSKLINNMRSDDNIEKLESLINNHHADLLNRLKADINNMTKDDYLLFIFSVLGFSSNAIALFLGVDKLTSIYERRKRLKNKIRKLDEQKSSYYLSFFQ